MPCGVRVLEMRPGRIAPWDKFPSEVRGRVAVCKRDQAAFMGRRAKSSIGIVRHRRLLRASATRPAGHYACVDSSRLSDPDDRRPLMRRPRASKWWTISASPVPHRTGSRRCVPCGMDRRKLLTDSGSWGHPNLEIRQIGRRYLATLLTISFERLVTLHDLVWLS
jgi:hypothetical protein